MIRDIAVSPDQATIAFTIARTNIKKNTTVADIYIQSTSGGNVLQLLHSNEPKSQISWRPDGQAITFLASSKTLGQQLYEISPDGKYFKQITNIDGGIDGYLYSPASNQLLVIKRVNSINSKRSISICPANARREI